MEWLGPIASVLGGAGQFAGGLKGLFGGGGQSIMQSMSPQNMFSSQTLLDLNERDFQWQKQLATDGIQMRVNDARKAGLHPLFALGGGQAGFTPPPLSVGMGSPSEFGPGGGDNLGSSLSNMGQGVSRALSAAAGPKERAQEDINYERERRWQEMQARDLDIQMKHADLALKTAQLGPPLPRPGDPMTVSNKLGTYEVKPNEVTTANPSAPFIAAGPGQPSVDFHRMADGGLMPAPPKSLNIEEVSSPGYMTWMTQNKLLPFTGSGAPTAAHLPKGAYRWQWNGMTWLPVYHADYINRSHGRDPWAHLPKRSPDWQRAQE